MLGFSNNDDYRRASDLLRDAGYTSAGLEEALGTANALSISIKEFPSLLRRTEELSRLNTLIRLFFLRVGVPEQAARQALAPMTLESWFSGDLLTPPNGEGQVVSRVELWPWGEFILAVDQRQIETPQSDFNFVVPPGPVTLMLQYATIRRPCQSALDLGTGSGLLGLMAAAHAKQVTATDMCDRAIAFARFNAKLNGVQNIRFLTGNLFEPVADECFELVICNPPFVISPTQRFIFRDSGLRGDLFCQQIVRSVPDYLTPGGYCQLLCNLAHEVGTDWRESLERWFDGIGCDAVALVMYTQNVSDYAMTWILSTESHDQNLVPKLYDEWLGFFESERIEAVSLVLITLRRSASDSCWTQIEEPPCDIVGPCGEELQARFAARDRLAAASSQEALLDKNYRLAPDVRIEQQHAMTDTGLQVEQCRLLKTGGLQYTMRTDPVVIGLLAQCTGECTLRELLQQMSQSLGTDVARLANTALPIVRSLVERGVLLIDDGMANPNLVE